MLWHGAIHLELMNEAFELASMLHATDSMSAATIERELFQPFCPRSPLNVALTAIRSQ
jgi:hypothetical protein